MRYYLIPNNHSNFISLSILAITFRDLNNGFSLLLFGGYEYTPGLNSFPSYTKVEAYNYVKNLDL